MLENLALEQSDAGRDDALHAEILVDYLTQALSGELSGQRFMIGALNFCTLMPMRSIPFRVVCLLGMNDGVYPRTLVITSYSIHYTKLYEGSSASASGCRS